MSNETFNNVLADLRKYFLELFLFLLAISADSIAVIQFWGGYRSEFTIALFVVGTISMWLFSFYVFFKKQNEISKISGSLIKQSIFPKWARRLALLGIMAIPVFIGSFLGWHYYYKTIRSSDKIIILVADFDGPDSQTYRVTETIIEQLYEATKEYDDVMVQTLGEVITAHQGNVYARLKADQNKASIVLWGWYAKTEEKALVTVHFDVLKDKLKLPLLQEKQTLKMAVAELESFEIQTRLSNDMSYLTLLTIGLAKLRANDYDSAIKLFSNVLTQPTLPDQMIDPAYIYIYRGDAYLLKTDLDLAIADYNKAIKLKPDDVVAYYNRGAAYYDKSDYIRALADFNYVIKFQSDDVDAYVARGHIYSMTRDYDHAIADYNYAIKLNPNDVVVYYNRGTAYYNKGDYDRAIVDYDYAIKLKPKDPDVYIARGNAYKNKGNYDRAMTDFNYAIKLKPDYFLAYYNRGITYENKNDYDHAIVDYDYAVKLKPEDPDAYIARGNAYKNKGNYDRAMTDFNYAIKLKPDYFLAYFNRGLAYENKNDYDRAIVDYDYAIKLKPEDPDAYIARGNAYFNKGNYDHAIADYTKSITLKPDGADAYNSRGDAYYNKDNYELAIADYTKAITLKPNDADAYNNRGDAYYNSDNYELAIADYNQAIKLNPNDANLYEDRGDVYSKVGPPDSAIANYRRAIAINPAYADVQNSLAWHFALRSEHLEEALALSQRSLKIEPENPHYWDTLAEIYFRMNRFREAKTANEKAKKFDEDKQLVKTIKERAQKIQSKL